VPFGTRCANVPVAKPIGSVSGFRNASAAPKIAAFFTGAIFDFALYGARSIDTEVSTSTSVGPCSAGTHATDALSARSSGCDQRSAGAASYAASHWHGKIPALATFSASANRAAT